MPEWDFQNANVAVADVKRRIINEVDPYVDPEVLGDVMHNLETGAFPAFSQIDTVDEDAADQIVAYYLHHYGPDIRRDRHGLVVDLLHETVCGNHAVYMAVPRSERRRHPDRSLADLYPRPCECGYHPWIAHRNNAFWRGEVRCGPREGLLDEDGRCRTLPTAEVQRLLSTSDLLASAV